MKDGGEQEEINTNWSQRELLKIFFNQRDINLTTISTSEQLWEELTHKYKVSPIRLFIVLRNYVNYQNLIWKQNALTVEKINMERQLCPEYEIKGIQG